MVNELQPTVRQPAGPIHRVTARCITVVRHLSLWIMLTMLGGYIVLHSPLRTWIATALGTVSRGCYFCEQWAIPTALVGPVSALLLIAAGVMAGSFVAIRSDGPGYERPLVFGLVTLSFIVVPAAVVGGIASWLQTALLRPPAGPLLSAVPAVLTILIGLSRGWRVQALKFELPTMPPITLTPLVGLVGGLAAMVTLASVLISLMHPATSGDALSYHAPLATFLWRDGNLDAFLNRSPTTWALASPGAAELWYGLLYTAGGESLADLGQLPFALLGCCAVAAYTRRLGMGRGAALLAACAYLLIPMVIMQIGAQPNDVTGAGLLMAVMALASMPAKNWTGRRTALIGMGSGLVAATKLALLPSVAGVLAFTIAAVAWTDRKPLLSKSAAKRVIALALSFLFVVAPWWVRNMARYGNPLYPQGLPLIGRGVFLKDFGPIDTSFVPGPAAWPLYPLLEAHDDRSGFGALVAAGMLPGFLFLLACRRRQPFVLLVLVTVIMVPPWWVFTLHEPRFFLALIGLGFAFLPWTLLVTPRRWRRHAFVVLAAAATFSVFVTADQALVPLASQPFTRPEFYDTVWGVDPAVLSLPENEGVLFNTGYAPTIPEYAAYYPLLGEARNRVVIQLDTDASAGEIVSMMRSANIRYAYVAVAPENRSVVRNLYPDALFELVHQSVIVPGPGNGARRTLYRAASGVEADGGTQRLLFRLR